MKAARQILRILGRDEKKEMFLWLLLDILISIADIVFLALLLFMVHLYTEPVRTTRFPFLSQWLTGRNSLLGVIIFFLLFSVKNLAGFLVFRGQCGFLFRVASRISKDKLVNYLDGDYSGYTEVDSSVHIREISYHPLDFCQHVLGGVQQIVTQTVLIALAIAGILWFNARLFFLLFVILLPPLLAVFYLIKGKLRSARKNARTSSERSLQYLQEAISGFVESNIYDRNEVFLDRFVTYQRQFNKYVTDQMIFQGLPGRMMEIFALLGIVVLIVMSRWSGNTNGTEVITIGVFMAAAYKIIPGIVKILNLSGQVSSYAFTIGDLVPGAPAASRERSGVGIRSVGFNRVGFSYAGRRILNNQCLELGPGDFLGIAGPSGKGKTTILNLLLGFLTPEEGEILINGVATTLMDRQGYWNHISYVKQQGFLIHDTIYHNITLNDGCYDPERLQAAIRAAGLEGMEDKVIAENGKNISGGQRQRIALARALYKPADLVILDEPFNELDEESENRLLDHFQQLAREGKLIILITHHKKSLSYCNKIISLDEA